MPRIPTENPTGRVQTTPDRTPFQSLSGDTGASQIGQALQQAGGALVQESRRLEAEAQRATEENNRRLAKQAQVDYLRRQGELWNGDGTPENPGFGNTQGEVTVNGAPTYRENLQRLRAEALQNIPEDVKDDLGLNLQQLEIEELNRANRYVQQQSRVAGKTASDAMLNQFRENALRNHTDPDAIGKDIARGKAEVRQYQESVGANAETIETELLNYETTVHTGVIERYLADKEVNAAEAYFKQNQKNIDPDIHARIIESLNASKNQNLGLILDQANDALVVARSGFKDPNEDAILGRLGEIDGSPRARKMLKNLRNASDTRASVQKFVRNKPIQEQAEKIRQLNQQETLTRAQLERRDALTAAHAAQVKAISKGFGLDMAQSNGWINGLENLDYAADDLDQQLRERLSQARHADSNFGVPVTILRPGEVTALEQRFANLPTQQLQTELGRFGTGLGRDGIDRLAAQIAGGDPLLGYALSYSKENPSLAVAAIEGRRFLAENPELKPTPTELRSGITEAYGNIFQRAPQAQRGFVDAAVAVYALERQRGGDLAFDQSDFEDVLGRVAGSPVEYNGQGVLPVYPNQAEREFNQMVNDLKQPDLIEFGTGSPVHVDGRPFTINEFSQGHFDSSRARLVTSGFGRYMIQTIDGGFVLNEDGGFYELNLNPMVAQ